MSLRIEEKLRIEKKNLYILRKWLSLKNFKKLYPKRIVTSLYFDNQDLQMYHDSIEGIVPRKKIRIRYYNNVLDKIYLEKKINSIEGRFKVSNKISKIKMNQYCKKGYTDKNYGVCNEKIKINYEREYFYDGKIRITIDSKIGFQKYNSYFHFKSSEIVAEIKTDFNFDRNFLNDLPFDKTRFSKYCNGIIKTYRFND